MKWPQVEEPLYLYIICIILYSYTLVAVIYESTWRASCSMVEDPIGWRAVNSSDPETLNKIIYLCILNFVPGVAAIYESTW